MCTNTPLWWVKILYCWITPLVVDGVLDRVADEAVKDVHKHTSSGGWIPVLLNHPCFLCVFSSAITRDTTRCCCLELTV
jgi:hypothetical protein